MNAILGSIILCLQLTLEILYSYSRVGVIPPPPARPAMISMKFMYTCAGLTVDTGKCVFIFNAAMAKYSPFNSTIF